MSTPSSASYRRLAVLLSFVVVVTAGLWASLVNLDRWPVWTGRPAAGQSPSADPVASTAPPAATSATAPLRAPGPVPTKGTGRFGYATGTSEVFGRAGSLRRYRVAVEQGAEEAPETFAAVVDLALGDPRSWTARGRLRFQRVPAGAAHEFTIYLATRETAGRMCAAGGVNIRVGGRPYTSCRATGKVIVNLDRWRLSVPHLVDAGVPLDTYRTYVVNHEVGHELGYGHQPCPGRRRPAPVMQQQTLFLNGCVVNPWPFPRAR